MSLKKLIQEMQSGVPEFAQGKEKGATLDLVGKRVTFENYDFLKDKDGDEYVVFTIVGSDKFYFGGQVLTDIFKTIESDPELTEEFKTEGFTVTVIQKKSKAGRNYISVK